jgi:hypothetical protein
VPVTELWGRRRRKVFDSMGLGVGKIFALFIELHGGCWRRTSLGRGKISSKVMDIEVLGMILMDIVMEI